MSKRNLTLLTDLYELTMMQGYYEKGQNEKVIFDVFKSDQSIDEMTGKYSLDLTNEEMIKL